MCKSWPYRCLLPSLVVLLLSICDAQTPDKRAFDLFPIDMKCACVKTTESTRLLISQERTIGQKIFQIFFSRKTGREVFRFAVGWQRGSQFLKWWNYGIAAEADFNGDGAQDYTWYGGDDTSNEMCLLLSSPSGYRKIDVFASFTGEWKRRFHTKAPDFAAAGYDIHVRAQKEGGIFTLFGEILPDVDPEFPTDGLRVHDKDLVLAHDDSKN